VDYIAQSGDSLEALAAHFNTTVDQIRTVNPQIPSETTTMPPGMPMKIPIYYLPFWGTTVQILPTASMSMGHLWSVSIPRHSLTAIPAG